MATSTSTSTSTTSYRAVTLPIAALAAMLSVSAASDDVSALKLSVRAPTSIAERAQFFGSVIKAARIPGPRSDSRAISEAVQAALKTDGRRIWEPSYAQEESRTQSPVSNSPASSRAASSPSSSAASSRSTSPTPERKVDGPLNSFGVNQATLITSGKEAEVAAAWSAARKAREAAATAVPVKQRIESRARNAPQPQGPERKVDGPLRLNTFGVNQATLITSGKEAEVAAAWPAARKAREAAANAAATAEAVRQQTQ